MKSLYFVDYAIISLYMVVMVVIGVFVSKYSKDDSDYFKGGNQVPWIMSGFSCFIGLVSAYMFVAASSKAYTTGLACVPLFTLGALGTFFCAFFLMTRWRRLRITSPMEYIEKRYGSVTRDIFTFIQVPAYTLGMGSLLYILCIFISSALGLTGIYPVLGLKLSGVHLCIIAVGMIIMFYTTVGGLWAVVVTDTVQFFIVMVVGVIIFPLSLIALGQGSVFSGVVNFIQNPPTPDYFKLVKPSQTLSFTLAFAMVGGIVTAGHFSMIQRASCVPTEKDARKVGIIAAILHALAPIFWVSPIFFMRSLLPDLANIYPNLENPGDGTYVVMTRMLLPNGMIGLTIAAILAATMSSMSTLFNINSMMLTENIYKQFFAKNASPRNLLIAGKALNVVVGVVAIILAILLSSYKDAFGTSLMISAHFGIVFAFPVIVGVMFRRIPWWSALVSMPLCLMYTLVLEFILPGAQEVSAGLIGHISKNLPQYQIFGAVILNIVVFAGAALFYRVDDPRNKPGQALFDILRKPVQQDGDQTVIIPNLKPYRIVGWTLLFFGFILILANVLTNTGDPNHVNIIAGILFAVLCACILWITSSKYSPIKLVKQDSREDRKRVTTDV